MLAATRSLCILLLALVSLVVAAEEELGFLRRLTLAQCIDDTEDLLQNNPNLRSASVTYSAQLAQSARDCEIPACIIKASDAAFAAYNETCVTASQGPYIPGVFETIDTFYIICDKNGLEILNATVEDVSACYANTDNCDGEAREKDISKFFKTLSEVLDGDCRIESAAVMKLAGFVGVGFVFLASVLLL